MRAKIIAYNESTSSNSGDFSLNSFWGSGYQNVFYLCSNLGRSTFEDTIETVTDATGQTTRTLNTSIERFSMSTLAFSPLLNFLKTIDKHEAKQLQIISTGDTYDITNVDIEDEGATLDPTQRVNITFELQPVTNTTNPDYVETNQKIAYWDNNNDGTPDINGNAIYSVFGFTTAQLYFEANGSTPASSGAVQMLVYSNRNGNRRLIARFNGQFGDNFNDSTKWQSSQSIWTYFLGSVGHTNVIAFQKYSFAEDNGYLSDELDDRAVKIEFELSIDGGQFQKTTLELVYALFGSFQQSGVFSSVSEYGVTTVNTATIKTTMKAINDVRAPLPAGTPQTSITSFFQTGSTAFSNTYELDTSPSGLFKYRNVITTSGGYLSETFRGQNGNDNYRFAIDPSSAVGHSENILAFTTGNDPHDIQFDWKFERDNGNTSFGTLGEPLTNGSKLELDGTAIQTYTTIVPSSTFVSGSASVTLPDEDPHDLRLVTETNAGFEIFHKYQVQIKPLF